MPYTYPCPCRNPTQNPYGGSSAAIEMIPDGDCGSTMTAPEAEKMIVSKEKHELVPQLRFAPGYHFLPTEFELLDVYLRGKIDGLKPPLDTFMDVDLLEFEPAKLVAERKAYGEGRYFFFTVRKEWPSNKDYQPRRKLQVNGVTASWKATGSVVKIYRPGTSEVVGTKRMLTYSSGRRKDDKYSMYEYVLDSKSQMDQWVLCTIQEKQHWNANQNKDKNANLGEDGKASGGKDKKRKRETETRVKPKTTTRKMKTATSQPQETLQQEQQHQEITPDISADPPPLLGHDQVDHHQALHEEGVMAFEETSPMIQVAAPRHEYPDGDQPYYHDASTQQETTTWDGPGEPPLMTQQQQGYQASMEEEQFDFLGAQHMLMLEHPFNTMALFHPQHLMFQYELLQQQIQDPFRTQGFHGDITGTLQDAPQFLQESGKPPQTSPDGVLGGPDPEPPSGDAYPYADSDAGMMDGVASTVDNQVTSNRSATDHQFNPVDFLGHNFDGNLAGNAAGSSYLAAELPGHGSNQTFHMCQHGVQWRCGGQQGPGARI